VYVGREREDELTGNRSRNLRARQVRKRLNAGYAGLSVAAEDDVSIAAIEAQHRRRNESPVRSHQDEVRHHRAILLRLEDRCGVAGPLKPIDLRRRVERTQPLARRRPE
jgi:hypothetical protein